MYNIPSFYKVLCEEAAMSAQDCLSRDAVEENKYPAILTMVARLLEVRPNNTDAKS